MARFRRFTYPSQTIVNEGIGSPPSWCCPELVIEILVVVAGSVPAGTDCCPPGETVMDTIGQIVQERIRRAGRRPTSAIEASPPG
jgi:hypothetical protein